MDIIGVDGKTWATFRKPQGAIDVATLPAGIFVVRSHVHGKIDMQKIAKY